MAKRRKKQSRGAKSDKSKQDNAGSQAPDGFWRQATAFTVGAVIAPLLILAFFDLGGALPRQLYGLVRWLVGSLTYLIPLILLYVSVKMFRSAEHKLPRASFWGLLLFLMSATGLAHLGVERELASAEAQDGNGGGQLGYLTIAALTPLLDTIGTALVLLSTGLIAGLFILRIPLKDFFSRLLSPFMKKPSPEGSDDAETAGEKNGFQLNEGVPIEKASTKLSNFKDTATKLTDAENHEALTSVNDPEWKLPETKLLIDKQDQANPGDVEANADIIKSTLSEFSIDVEMEEANVGPRVTQYTLKPSPSVRLNRITSLDNNLALGLAAESIRMEAPIPGKRAVGIEVPNKKAATVRIHGLLESKEWKNATSPLSFAIGRDIAGVPVIGELDKMPHLMVAGQTGSGKSVMINTLLSSLLFKNSPADLRMILVDPKRVELKPFDEIPHLLTPVITEPEKTISALKWATAEMERRYQTLSDANRRNIAEYNALKKEENMPYIVIVIDELADLMMMAAREVEALIVRLAQKARAVGIHLVLATQRPSVNVITGLIKANVPARIAFTVAQQVDSRTILDQAGAEKLLGLGDMLYLNSQMPKPRRIQGALIEISEVEKITDFVRMQRAPEYDDEIVSQPVQLGSGGVGVSDDAEDSYYEEAVRLVAETGKASTSFLQRRFSIGYTRAARLIDMMEQRGVVAPAKGNKPRDVLITSADDVSFGETEDDQSL